MIFTLIFSGLHNVQHSIIEDQLESEGGCLSEDVQEEPHVR